MFWVESARGRVGFNSRRDSSVFNNSDIDHYTLENEMHFNGVDGTKIVCYDESVLPPEMGSCVGSRER